MPTFLCLQRSLPSTSDASSEAPSPAQMQEMYARFGEWQQTFADQLVDMGGKLGAGTLVHAQDAKDGPFIEVKELVGGYMIVEADDLEGAIAVASACPGLVRPGSGVEVVEIQRPG
jgi:hypothetical protein